MSLLLEALKKAELAKQQGSATQPPDGATPAEPGGAGLTLEPAPSDAGERPLITRDRLPDITQPLEILSEDLPSAGARREGAPASAALAPQPGSAAGGLGTVAAERGRRTPSEPEPEEQDRLSARQLFEAKDMDYNPRRPFFIAVGALGVAAVAVIGYFLLQIYAPQPSFYTGPAGGKSTPIATAPAPPGTAAATAPATPAPPTQPAATPVTLPPAGATPAAAPAATIPKAPQPSPSTGTPRPPRAGDAIPPGTRAPVLAAGALAEAAPAPRAPASAVPAIKVTRPEPRVDPGLERAWRALEAGNLAVAKEEYLRVLQANPLDRDALLGLAVIDARSQDFESAEARYFKVLELDPRDPYAQAGVIALRGQTDPIQSESRLKNLLVQYPDSTLLHYALGNLYAGQARWPDAQAAYFKAFSGSPENADYAYNLAVSLDQLHQPKLALEYYQRSLTLAQNRAVGFNSALVEARVRELAR